MSEQGDFTEPTLAYWQELTGEVPARFSATPPFRFGYPVALPCGRILVLPLRALPDKKLAVASLIANQASHSVVAALADHMADEARWLGAELVVGLPTLGLAFAALVAERLGQPRYAPLGYSRKFWYDDALSEPVSSITSPEAGKRLRLDPNLVPLVRGRRVVIVDDAISTGTTAIAACRLLSAPRCRGRRHRGGDEADQSLADTARCAWHRHRRCAPAMAVRCSSCGRTAGGRCPRRCRMCHSRAVAQLTGCSKASALLRRLDRLPHPRRGERHVEMVDAEVDQRIHHRIDEGRRRADGAGFPAPLMPSGLVVQGTFCVAKSKKGRSSARGRP